MHRDLVRLDDNFGFSDLDCKEVRNNVTDLDGNHVLVSTTIVHKVFNFHGCKLRLLANIRIMVMKVIVCMVLAL